MRGLNDLYLNSEIGAGILLQWRDDRYYTNIPHLVIHHDPDGFTWGHGNGSADLALNILESVLQREHYHGRRLLCYRGKCFELAWQLHQDFKREWLDRLPQTGGAITCAEVVRWIDTRGRSGA